MTIACLPWYALPETEAAEDALWSVLARQMREQGIPEVPGRLSRGVPIPGVFCDPRLLLGQCCGYDLVYGFSGVVQPVATPRYLAEGCEDAEYRSFVLVREDSTVSALEDLRGGVCAVNGFNSQSGTNALRGLVAPLSRDGRFFGAVKVSGAHVKSLAMLLAGEADMMAMDCVLHGLLKLHRPRALAGTRILCRSDPAPAPPLITSATADGDLVARLRAALAGAMADPDAAGPRATLLIGGVAVLPLQSYAPIVEMEAAALGRGYLELHATTPARSAAAVG
jgi:ABC-type phosphate/phosphonate transport system substrate-binding protein